jgi:hypothetical protein
MMNGTVVMEKWKQCGLLLIQKRGDLGGQIWARRKIVGQGEGRREEEGIEVGEREREKEGICV